MKILHIKTSRREILVDITDQLAHLVREVGMDSGILLVYSPHTTTGLTINEGADPDVCRDILEHLRVMIPQQGNFQHVEGNADAHIKASLMGSSVQVIIDQGRLVLGTWQRVFLGEFDGPRSRKIWVKFLS